MDSAQPKQPATYFTAAPWKLALMSLCTSGIYDLYWFYRNWKLYKQRTGLRIRPVERAIFTIFFAYSMFDDICDKAGSSGVQKTFHPAMLALAYVSIFVTTALPTPLGYISYATFIPLIIANELAAAVSRANDPDFVENNRLSIGNLIAIVLGLGYIAANVALEHMQGPNAGMSSMQEILKMSEQLNQLNLNQ
jgi:hypothetical protein